MFVPCLEENNSNQTQEWGNCQIDKSNLIGAKKCNDETADDYRGLLDYDRNLVSNTFFYYAHVSEKFMTYTCIKHAVYRI